MAENITFSKKRMSGWGRYPLVEGEISKPENESGLSKCLRACGQSERLARGLGRSYGDAALSADKLIITEKLNRLISFDEKTGILLCQAGVSFQELIDTFLPRGWFPPVTPGTKFVTMGGALASDIHGKNHHKDGSFINFVRSFKIIDAQQKESICSRQMNSDLFWATAGGMGLTGIVSELEIQLKAVKSPNVLVRKIRCKNLANTMDLMESYENQYEYSVCWIDCLASGKDLGRSILILGRHQENIQQIDEKQRKAKSRPSSIKIPADMPAWILNRYSIGAFNGLYYQLMRSKETESISYYEPFFYPLDAILDWNRLYGDAGFIQYQCVLPLERSKEGMEEILALSSKRGRSSFLAVLKKFGAGHGLLSFPMPGYTITLDMPVKPGLFEFTGELDQIVLKHGGRVYLTKDACLNAETFRKMYAEYPDWLAIKKAADPDLRFSSALSKRLMMF